MRISRFRYIFSGVVLVLVVLCCWIFMRESSLPHSGFDSSKKVGLSRPSGEESIIRYDPERDPRLSDAASQDYYAAHESMIREFYGDDVVGSPLNNLRAGRDILESLDALRRFEIYSGVTLVEKYLNHPQIAIQHEAARVLCYFNNSKGFDFVLLKMKEDESGSWWKIFSDVFVDDAARKYANEIKLLLEDAHGDDVKRFVISKVLARSGDASSLDPLFEVVERNVDRSFDTVVILSNVEDKRVQEMAGRIVETASNPEVVVAAEMILAKSGDVNAVIRLLEAARELIQLEPTQNADGSKKPGSDSVTGAKSLYWNQKAFVALEYGFEAIPEDDAVPVLREIGLKARNVRFSEKAVILLAKIGNGASRDALQEIASHSQMRTRQFESSLFTTIGKALCLFSDSQSDSLSQTMFGGDEFGLKMNRFLAETRGWRGVFKK